MAEISRTALFGKLDSLAYKAIESATTFCKMRGNPYVELVHWLHQILQLQDSDVHRICTHFDIDAARLSRDLTISLDNLPRGASSVSDLSSHVEDAVERGWVWATLRFDEGHVRTAHLLIALLKTPGLRHTLPGISAEFGQIKADDLIEDYQAVLDGSPETVQAAALAANRDTAGADGGAMAPATMGKHEALERFTRDMTAAARAGEIDPVVGRDDEIRQMVDILMRRRQNNPILTGEAGVGKTAVVEGFAARIARRDVPPPLQDVVLRSLDVGLLQAGASMKGEFENRLRQVIEEVQSSEKPIILFIDEAHTLIGAGGSAGTGDAANLLKPALARGTLRTIGATTWAEYKKHIEKDPALTRRFQVVQVLQPEEGTAIDMMRAMADTWEAHHRIQLRDEAMVASVKLSSRYIPARQLPDKAVSLLDTACARVAVSQHAVPARVEDSRRRIEALETELEILHRESVVGLESPEQEGKTRSAVDAERAHLESLEQHWVEEKGVVDEILELRSALRARSGGSAEEAGDEATVAPEQDAPDLETVETTATGAVVAGEDSAEPAPKQISVAENTAQMLERLHVLQAQLEERQGDAPMILPSVDGQAVASVVADWTGIPVGRMVRDEIDAVLGLSQRLAERVKGQDHALEMMARRVQTSRAQLDDPNKPVGVFMLAGPSGVGKTETALTLAEVLYGGEQNMITINMSEFQEAHTVSTLKGAPPGYVGYGEGGVLTEAVRRRPYSVVLLDEIEKAHPDVHEIFFQVFDKGRMEDGEGRLIDFRNTLIILTTNVGTEMIMQAADQGSARPDPEELAQYLRQPLLEVFPAALLGRIVTIPYYPLSDEMLRGIVRLQLQRVEQRISKAHDVPFSYDDTVVDLMVKRCTEIESGGRMIDSILTNTMLPVLSQEFLVRLKDEQPVMRVHVTVSDNEFAYAFD